MFFCIFDSNDSYVRICLLEAFLSFVLGKRKELAVFISLLDASVLELLDWDDLAQVPLKGVKYGHLRLIETELEHFEIVQQLGFDDALERERENK